jgi:hypothetical protein
MAYGQHPGYGQPATSDYPVQLSVAYPERSSRLLALFTLPYFLVRLLALIPAVIVLWFVGIAAFIVIWIAQWAVLFTGRYPQGMHTFAVGYLRWTVRVSAYLYGLTDKYPPFRLAP